MQSVYDKDIGKLWIIFFLALIFSISLIGYSYSYPVDKVYDDNYSITTVYNSGKNTWCVLNNDYKISVIGYNRTNKNIDYQIYVKLDKKLLGENITLTVRNKESNLYQEFDLKEIMNDEFKIGNFTLLKNIDNYLEEYVFRLKSSENIDDELNKNIKISVRY